MASGRKRLPSAGVIMNWRVSRSSLVFGLMAAVLILASAVPAHALLFEEQKLADGRWILLVRDCGIRENEKCLEEQTQFSAKGYYPRSEPARQYAGDAAQLRTYLGRRNYDEVHLYSGG